MRTELISTSRLKTYKRFIYVFMVVAIVVCVGISIQMIFKAGNYFYIIYLVIMLTMAVRAFLDTRKLKTISYDDSSVYYEKDGYEVQIPFEDIKNIELYKGWAINLHRPTQDGDRIRFTPSFWYPFNFRKKDAEINVLRDKIDNYKRQLGSHNSEPLPGRRI